MGGGGVQNKQYIGGMQILGGGGGQHKTGLVLGSFLYEEKMRVPILGL